MLHKLLYFLKNNRVSYHYFYKPYKRLVKKQKFEIPTADTDLCIESYPSSANTFFYNVVKCFKKDLNIAHHTHALQSLKLAKQHNVKTIVIIRSPEEAIPSRIVRFGSSTALSIYEYERFYSFVLNNQDFFRVVFFDDLVEDLAETIENLSDYIGIETAGCDFEQIEEKVFDHIKDYNEDTDQIAIPTKDRSREKSEILNELEINNDFQRVNALYHNFFEVYR